LLDFTFVLCAITLRLLLISATFWTTCVTESCREGSWVTQLYLQVTRPTVVSDDFGARDARSR